MSTSTPRHLLQSLRQIALSGTAKRWVHCSHRLGWLLSVEQPRGGFICWAFHGQNLHTSLSGTAKRWVHCSHRLTVASLFSQVGLVALSGTAKRFHLGLVALVEQPRGLRIRDNWYTRDREERERERRVGEADMISLFTSKLVALIVCCVRNSVLLMCIITALNDEVLHTEHRDLFPNAILPNGIWWFIVLTGWVGCSHQEGDLYRYVDTNWRLLCAHHPRSRRRARGGFIVLTGWVGCSQWNIYLGWLLSGTAKIIVLTGWVGRWVHSQILICVW